MRLRNVVQRFYNFFEGFKNQEEYVREAMEHYFFLKERMEKISDTELVKICIEHVIQLYKVLL